MQPIREKRLGSLSSRFAWGVLLLVTASAVFAQGEVNVVCSVPLPWCEALAAAYLRETGTTVNLTVKTPADALAQHAAIDGEREPEAGVADGDGEGVADWRGDGVECRQSESAHERRVHGIRRAANRVTADEVVFGGFLRPPRKRGEGEGGGESECGEAGGVHIGVV